MRTIEMLKEYSIAYEASDWVIKKLNYDGSGMVDTDKVTDIVAQLSTTNNFRDIFPNGIPEGAVGKSVYNDGDRTIVSTKITRLETSFSTINPTDHDSRINTCGAMMCVSKEDKTQDATILLNTDSGAIFKRFSYVHELGHLITGCYNFADASNYTLSTHIDYNVFSLQDSETLPADSYLQHEQIANIFALRVLMPKTPFFNAINYSDNLSEVANFFGVTKEAVICRLRLVE